jgi:hypothetical protein
MTTRAEQATALALEVAALMPDLRSDDARVRLHAHARLAALAMRLYRLQVGA